MTEEQKPTIKEQFNKWWADDAHWLPRTWRDIRDNRVGLTTYKFNEAMNEYTSDYVHIPRKEIPPLAVHVTGKRNKEYALDLTSQGEYAPPGTCNAIDLYLYMQTSAFDEALTFSKKKTTAIDPKILVIAAVGIAALVLYMFMR